MKAFRFITCICLGSLVFLLFNGSLSAHDSALSCLSRFCLQSEEVIAVSSSPAIADPVRTDDLERQATRSQPDDIVAQSEEAASEESSATATSPPAFLQDVPVIVLGIVASLLAGLATGVGALPILFTRRISDRLQSALLGFAAGVMLAATSFSLLLPSIERVTESGGGALQAAGVAVGGTLLGSGFIWFTDRTLPYDFFLDHPISVDKARFKGIWLFILAIAIHNFPEGLAVGVGFGGGNIGNGLALAIGIGLQNLPEGLAVALALLTQSYSPSKAFWIALLTGLLEPLGGIVGAGILSLGEALLPWGLAFAAGAMLFVIGDEVIPEAQYLESGKLATIGIVIGFIVMMFLDVALGG